MPVQGSLSVERMCRLAQVSRAGFYRSLRQREPEEEEMEVRSAMQAIVLAHRGRYGYRRVAAELRRRGMVVNHKRVARLMREDNLLSVPSKAFVATSDSGHKLDVYLNLAARMTLRGINQLWVADMTYIRLQRGFVYLAVVLDAWSRKVVGWELDGTLAARLPIAALERAITGRNPAAGLVHHSDRGIQYACDGYAAVLNRHRIVPSMSRPGNPYDNASCESFMKTLKREEIYAGKYTNIDDLRANLEEFLDRYYNRLRLHSALGYRSPEEFEAAVPAASPPRGPFAGATLSFFRHKEDPRSDVSSEGGEPAVHPSDSPNHRLDASPVGYSSAGWSPPEPTSASPTETIVANRRQDV